MHHEVSDHELMQPTVSDPRGKAQHSEACAAAATRCSRGFFTIWCASKTCGCTPVNEGVANNIAKAALPPGPAINALIATSRLGAPVHNWRLTDDDLASSWTYALTARLPVRTSKAKATTSILRCVR